METDGNYNSISESQCQRQLQLDSSAHKNTVRLQIVRHLACEAFSRATPAVEICTSARLRASFGMCSWNFPVCSSKRLRSAAVMADGAASSNKRKEQPEDGINGGQGMGSRHPKFLSKNSYSSYECSHRSKFNTQFSVFSWVSLGIQS